MIEFKPRLALFYIAAIVVISLLTNRITITSQIAAAMIPSTTNVESSK